MLARFLLAFFVLVLACFVFLVGRYLIVRSGANHFLSFAGNFLFLPEGAVDQYQGRTNVLILGKADGEPELTDTLIVASIGRNKDPVLISIPRDIWIDEFADKINSAYWRGNEKEDGGGLVLSKAMVGKIIGVPVHYSIVFDFNSFIKLIDILGGVEVEVERSFTDKRFPITGRENDECGGDLEYNCRYETVSFEQGVELMNGERALKFARSRHSEDKLEGTDFARAKRQQKILKAVRNKLLSSEILFNPTKLKKIWDLFSINLETDLTEKQIGYLARAAFDSRNSVKNFTIPEELLFNPPYSKEYNNLYVFIPSSANQQWTEVHSWLKGIF